MVRLPENGARKQVTFLCDKGNLANLAGVMEVGSIFRVEVPEFMRGGDGWIWQA